MKAVSAQTARRQSSSAVRLVVPTSRIRAPGACSRWAGRNPSPISISSPRLIMTPPPAPSAVAARTSAAALLLTTCTAPAAGTARARASSAPPPRRPRLPVARSNSTSVQPAAASMASRAAADSGARPRLVCTRTPAALITGVRVAAAGGSDATRRPPVLKTGGATRHPDASGGDVTRARAAPAIHPAGAPGAVTEGVRRQALKFGRVTDPGAFRLTQYARGGGCACKIPPGELEETISKLAPDGLGTDLIVGVEHGDDGAVVRVGPAMAVVVTADFFTPVVDDAYACGRIAAANALSDIYAMGGEPIVALNLLGWPRDKLPADLAAEVLRGGLDTGRAAHCHVAGGHSIDDPEPKYGMAVTGTPGPAPLLRTGAGQPGPPPRLTQPIAPRPPQ